MSNFLHKCALVSSLCCTCLLGEEVSVDLRNPTYQNGSLITNEGGVIQGEELRIQATCIRYTQNKEEETPVHEIYAEGNLLIQYKDRAYIGESLTYDFLTKTGCISNGRTTAAMWFVGGELITLRPDGSYGVKGVTVTTCENKDSSWDFHAGWIDLHKKDLFEARNVQFRLFQTPFFWFPSMKLNLRKFREPIFRYTVNWDRGQGPRVAIRYQFYSWEDFALYGRIEYRWKTGWGGALETDYAPKNHNTTFVTKSFIGKDRLQTAPDKMRRYRLQGALNSVTDSGKTTTRLTWDKYNDVRMPSLFKPDDFEVSTSKQTIFYVRHQEKAGIGIFKLRPRINSFESLKQDLPLLYGTLLPTQIGNTGIYNFISLKAAYVDFAYSDHLVTSLKDFHSARIEFKEKIQRPLRLGPLTLTPFAGVNGIFYSNSPSHNGKSIGVFSYGVDCFARAERSYAHYKHVIEPYANLYAVTKPTVPVDKHYIFSIADGYDRIHQVQAGVRTLLFSKRRPVGEASFTADLFVNGFFSDPTIPQFIPRAYLNLDWRLPSVFCSLHNAWNFRHHQIEYIKARLLWTLGENIAFSIEGRYRSKYHWRKADEENFILDVSRTETELLLSPLSDRRVMILTKLFMRLNPLWEAQISTIQGFYRIGSRPFLQVKADLSTWISSSFKVRLSYSHIRFDDRVSFHLDMMKKPPLTKGS